MFHRSFRYFSSNISRVIVYTDGSCSFNGFENAKAGVGVFWGEDHKDNISEPLSGKSQTNNRAEYMAVLRALETAQSRGYQKLTVRTDSLTLVTALEEWITKWRKNGWKTASLRNDRWVRNSDLIKRIDELRSSMDVIFEHVEGHSDDHGNKMADKLAREGANL